MRGLIPLPSQVDRFVRLPCHRHRGQPIRFLMLEDVVRLFMDQVFPGFAIVGHGLFRLIRDTDVEFEEEAEDLVRSYETALKRRRRGSVIHLEVDSADAGGDLSALVAGSLDTEPDEVFVQSGIIGVVDLKPADRG